jgi:DNA-binding PadR family transcriptional regulator
VSLRHLVLGLIAENPMSGYDIRQFLGKLSWLIGSPSCGSLYPALRRLLQDGLATVEVKLRQAKPPKKVYHITEDGRIALQEWIEQPTEPGSLKAFAMRLILADNLSRSGLIAHLKQRRTDVAGNEARLAGVAQMRRETAASGQRLALDYALAVARAERDWLDGVLKQLSQKVRAGAGTVQSQPLKEEQA